MYEIKKEYYSNFSFDKISDLVKNGTILTTFNKNIKFVSSNKNIFYLSEIFDPSIYISTYVSYFSDLTKFNIDITQTNNIVTDNIIDIIIEFKLDNGMIFYHNFYITHNYIKTIFSYSLDDDQIVYNYIIKTIANYGLNWVEKRLTEL